MYEFGNSVSRSGLQLPADRLPARQHPDGSQRPVRRQPDLPICRQREPEPRVTRLGRGRRRLAAQLRLAGTDRRLLLPRSLRRPPAARSARPWAATACGAPSCAWRPGEHARLLGPMSSGSIIKGDLWRGPGTIDRKHYEGKINYALPNGGEHQLPDRAQRLFRL